MSSSSGIHELRPTPSASNLFISCSVPRRRRGEQLDTLHRALVQQVAARRNCRRFENSPVAHVRQRSSFFLPISLHSLSPFFPGLRRRLLPRRRLSHVERNGNPVKHPSVPQRSSRSLGAVRGPPINRGRRSASSRRLFLKAGKAGDGLSRSRRRRGGAEQTARAGYASRKLQLSRASTLSSAGIASRDLF